MCSDMTQMSPVSALWKRYGRVLEAVPVGQPCSTDAARECMSDPGRQKTKMPLPRRQSRVWHQTESLALTIWDGTLSLVGYYFIGCDL